MAIDLSKQLAARWTNPEPSHVALLRKAGIEGLVLTSTPGAAFSAAAAAGQLQVTTEAEALQPAGVASIRGQWPGIRRPAKRFNWDTDFVASASLEPWIDSNAYLVPLERALSGKSRPVIAYQATPETGVAPDRPAPFESLEIALVEAALQGGNYLLSIEPRYRAALLANDAAALTAWQSLGRTAAWLREQAPLCGLPAPATLTALVEPGNPATAEIANLLYRRGASPRLVASANLQAPGDAATAGLLVLVAAGLKSIPALVWRHAQVGATVIIDNAELLPPAVAAQKAVKQEPDRNFYAHGKGRIVVYRKRVADPSEFALDMIDLVGHRRRPARIWNANSAVVFATAGQTANEALIHVINYGSAQQEEVQIRIHGHFQQASLLRPETAPVRLMAKPRGLATEVFLPSLRRAAIVRFRV